MAQDIVGSLFGLNPNAIYGQQMDTEMNQAINFANLNPAQQANYGGFLAGQMLGRGVSGLMGAEDPRLQQARVVQEAQQQGFDVTSPEGLQQLAQFFVQKGQPGLASQVATQLQGMQTAQATEQLKLAQAQAALREKKGSPETQAEQVKYEQFVNQYGPEAGANAFLNWKQSQKVGVASAGAAQYGQEKIANLSGAQNIVEGYTKKPMERLQAIGEAQTFLSQSGVNPAAVPQLRRALVKLGGGDSQVAQREVQQIAGNMGIAGNVAEAVNQFFTGTPSKDQLDLISKVVKGAETYYAGQYSKGRQQAETVLNAAKLDPVTRSALLPPAYNLPEQKKYPNAPKVGTIQNGYRFKGGNPADQNSWEKL